VVFVTVVSIDQFHVVGEPSLMSVNVTTWPGVEGFVDCVKFADKLSTIGPENISISPNADHPDDAVITTLTYLADTVDAVVLFHAPAEGDLEETSVVYETPSEEVLMWYVCVPVER